MSTTQSPRLQVASELSLPGLGTLWELSASLQVYACLAGGTYVPHTLVSPSLWQCPYLVGVCTEVKVF